MPRETPYATVIHESVHLTNYLYGIYQSGFGVLSADHAYDERLAYGTQWLIEDGRFFSSIKKSMLRGDCALANKKWRDRWRVINGIIGRSFPAGSSHQNMRMDEAGIRDVRDKYDLHLSCQEVKRLLAEQVPPGYFKCCFECDKEFLGFELADVFK